MIATGVDARVDAGVINELHYPPTGINSRVNDGVADESHHPSTGTNTGVIDAVCLGANGVPDHPDTGVNYGVNDVVSVDVTVMTDYPNTGINAGVFDVVGVGTNAVTDHGATVVNSGVNDAVSVGVIIVPQYPAAGVNDVQSHTAMPVTWVNKQLVPVMTAQATTALVSSNVEKHVEQSRIQHVIYDASQIKKNSEKVILITDEQGTSITEDDLLARSAAALACLEQT